MHEQRSRAAIVLCLVATLTGRAGAASPDAVPTASSGDATTLPATSSDQSTSSGDAYDDDEGPERPDGEGAAPPTLGGEDDEPLTAGGLTAPGALDTGGSAGSDVEAELAEADRRDSGRGLEFVWAFGEFGLSHVGLAGLSDNDLAPGAETTGTGVGYGAGLGVRILYFVAGAHFRMASVGSFDAWSLVGELGMKLPLGNFEPYALLGAGYVGVTGLEAPTGPSFGAQGFDLRLTAGLDYYLSDYVSVGAAFGGDLLLLSRGADAALDGALATSGSSVGGALQLAFVFGLHF